AEPPRREIVAGFGSLALLLLPAASGDARRLAARGVLDGLERVFHLVVAPAQRTGRLLAEPQRGLDLGARIRAIPSEDDRERIAAFHEERRAARRLSHLQHVRRERFD